MRGVATKTVFAIGFALGATAAVLTPLFEHPAFAGGGLQGGGLAGGGNCAGPGANCSVACVQTANSGGEVDVRVPSTDCIDIAGNACGVACPASTSINLATGKQICLANGSDCVSDSSGIASFTANISAPSVNCGVSCSATNIAAGNSMTAGTNLVVNGSFYMQNNGVGRWELSTALDSNAAAHTDFVEKGAGDVQLPRVANASLLSCTASTEDATHSQAGATAYDSTNNAHVTCNGTRWVFDDLWTTCTMASGTSCTAAVPSGTVCICMSSAATSSPLGSSCAVSSTTATCTSTVSNSDVWNIQVH